MKPRASALTAPLVIEIQDSLVHDLDLSAPELSGTTLVELGEHTLLLGSSIVIRCGRGDHWPIIRLARPLRFRPTLVRAADPVTSPSSTQRYGTCSRRFEGGVHGRRRPGLPAWHCPHHARSRRPAGDQDRTFDPGGYRRRQTVPGRQRALPRAALHLPEPYGFADPLDEDAFQPTPDVVVERSICGASASRRGLRAVIEDSIIDAAEPGGAPALAPLSLSSPLPTLRRRSVRRSSSRMPLSSAAPASLQRAAWSSGPIGSWCSTTKTAALRRPFLRRRRRAAAELRLRPRRRRPACVHQHVVRRSRLWPASPRLGHSHLLARRGRGDEAMGATNFLFEAHKWTNLQIRLREFMPIGGAYLCRIGHLTFYTSFSHPFPPDYERRLFTLGVRSHREFQWRSATAGSCAS